MEMQMEIAKTNKISDNNGAFSYDEAVELTGHGSYNYLLLAACSVTAFAVGLDMFGFSMVVDSGSCDLRLSIPISGLLKSAPLAGLVFAFPWGYYADTAGRRRALLLSTTIGFVFATLSSFSPYWQVLLFFKFIGCVFSTASYTISIAYLGESIGSARQNRYIFIMNSANVSADFFFNSYLILPLDVRIPIPWLGITLRSWRIYSLVIAAPLGLGALMLLLLYESPKLLATRGKTEQALEILTKIFERNGGKKNEYPVKVISMDGVEEIEKKTFINSVVKQTVPLFKPPLLWRTTQLSHLISICISTNNVFLMWYPMIVNSFYNSFSTGVVDDRSFCERVVANMTLSAGTEDQVCNDTISKNTMYAGMMLGMTFTILNLVAATVASYKRLILIALYLVSGACLVSLQLLREPVTNMVAFSLVQCTIIGMSSVSSYFVDLYPTAYRGLVASLSVMVGRLVGLAGINVVGATIVNYCSITFYCWTLYIASGIAVALFLPSDSKQIK